MFKTNSNSDHMLKMTAQVAQINALVGKKNPWDGEKRWMRQPFPTIRRGRCKNNVAAANISTSDPQDRVLRVCCER